MIVCSSGGVDLSNGEQSSTRLKPPIAGFIRQHWFLFTVGVAWAAAMLTISLRAGVQHDYSAYLAIWELITTGGDPWSTNNVYGPVFNTFAPLAYFFYLGPKLVFSMAFVLVTLALAWKIVAVSESALGQKMVIFAVLIPMNFLVIGIVFLYGLNDGLVAAFLGLAVLARYRGSLYLAGFILGVACLLKFYPGVLIPFFCLNRRELDLRVMYSSVITIFGGLAASLALWGSSIISAWAWIGQRSAGFLSLQAALERSPFGLIPASVVSSLGAVNVFLVLVSVAIALAFTWWLKASWLEGSTLGLLMVLLVYKGGHQQQYLPWLMLAASLLLLKSRSAFGLAVLSVPLALFLSAFQLGFHFRAADQFALIGILPMDVGYATTILGIGTITAYVIYMRFSIERVEGIRFRGAGKWTYYR